MYHKDLMVQKSFILAESLGGFVAQIRERLLYGVANAVRHLPKPQVLMYHIHRPRRTRNARSSLVDYKLPHLDELFQAGTEHLLNSNVI